MDVDFSPTGREFVAGSYDRTARFMRGSARRFPRFSPPVSQSLNIWARCEEREGCPRLSPVRGASVAEEAALVCAFCSCG